MTTTFLDLDPIEEHMGLAVSQMSNGDLLKYCETYFLMSFDHTLKDNVGMAHGRLKWLRNNYDAQAGEIIKWVWFRYDGVRDGQKFTFSWFTDKQMWFVRRLQGEMQGHRVELLKRLARPAYADQTFTVSGFMTGTALTARAMTTAEIIAGGVPNSQSQERIPQR